MHIKRKPRSLEERKNYKANEISGMLLYYLRVCLNGILPKRYLDNFQLLSSSIYKLLETRISNKDLDETENKLNQFVNEFELLYG